MKQRDLKIDKTYILYDADNEYWYIWHILEVSKKIIKFIEIEKFEYRKSHIAMAYIDEGEFEDMYNTPSIEEIDSDMSESMRYLIKDAFKNT